MNHSLNGNNSQIKMYTTDWCPDCWRAKKVMESMQIVFEEINILHDEDAIAIVESLNDGHRTVPTIVFPDGSVLAEPKTATLMGKLQTLV